MLRPGSASNVRAPQDAARALERWCEERGWTGSDPYDALNARVPLGPLRSTVLGRRMLTQAVKRSPANLRPALRVPPGRGAAALAAGASAYARATYLPPGESARKLRGMVELLEATRSGRFRQRCWGYHFDVQTRVFFYPAGSPNTIATSFAGLALLDAYERLRDSALLAAACDVGAFFLEHVPQTEAGDGAYFGYLPGDRTPIHNANLLVCALLARLHAATGDERFDRPARAGAAYTVRRQRPDGSWPYGERPGLEWVDNFHTGYVLEALLACRRSGIEGLDEAIGRGLSFYRSALFEPDGAPRYTTRSLYPIDIQCVAQAIQTFSLAARDTGDAALASAARTVYGFAERTMARRDGAFVFQRGRAWTIRTPHVRWAAAPMLLALTHLAALSRS